MPAIPNSEPSTITAGETVQWTKSLPDYPASTWTLKYALQITGAIISITAATSGNDFSVSVPAATSATYVPGQYLFTAFVENGSIRYKVGTGALTILPSPLAAIGATHATRMLALIEAALESRIPNGLEKTDIDGQSLERIPVIDLLSLQEKYLAKVKLEQAAARAAAGVKSRTTIGIRFVRP